MILGRFSMITPRVLKGFRDQLPHQMIEKNKIIAALTQIFEKFGFVPIDTPSLEYTEILLGKGSGETDKQIYRFEDHGKRDVALRFDLTVPLARYVSQHYSELIFPFKPYHIGTVWRGENTQKGRYREFNQCDFDILGTEAIGSDLEILLMVNEGLSALSAGDFVIHVNNRKILNALLKMMDSSDKSTDVLRIIDKVYKIGTEQVITELKNDVGLNGEQLKILINFLNMNESNPVFEITGEGIFKKLNSIKEMLPADQQGDVEQTEQIFKTIEQIGVLHHFAYNPAITRGLDYYTGLVFESFIKDRIEFGSVCSGGRYDNLTSLYSKNPVSGVGGAFGLDRLVALMEDKALFTDRSSTAEVFIFQLEEKFLAQYYNISRQLQHSGINCEVSLENKKMGLQFKTADRKKIPYVIIAGEVEVNMGRYNLKNIISGVEWKELTISEIVQKIKEKA